MVCWLNIGSLTNVPFGRAEGKYETPTIVGTLSVLISFCVNEQSVAAQGKIKFPVGVGTKTIDTNMFWLATKKGLFDEFGLDVQPKMFARLIDYHASIGERVFISRARPRIPLKYIDPSYLQQAIKELG